MLETFLSQNADIDDSTLMNCNVLVVDDELISAIVMTEMVSKVACAQYVCDSEEALGKCLSSPPDLVILDVNMPGKNGLELCRELRVNPSTEDIPVIFATASTEHDVQKKCWDVGAFDFVVKPVLETTLVNRVKNCLLNQLRIKFLSEISFRDSLTGLCNRHYLNSEVKAALKSTARNKGSFGIIVIDIDYFKHYNDTYGHLEGDRCLIAVAQAIQKAAQRPSDITIRFGGEEFVIALPNTDGSGTRKVAERALREISRLKIEHRSSPSNVLTASAGYTFAVVDNNTSIEALILDADLALLDAKKSGRDTVRCL